MRSFRPVLAFVCCATVLSLLAGSMVKGCHQSPRLGAGPSTVIGSEAQMPATTSVRSAPLSGGRFVEANQGDLSEETSKIIPNCPDLTKPDDIRACVWSLSQLPDPLSLGALLCQHSSSNPIWSAEIVARVLLESPQHELPAYFGVAFAACPTLPYPGDLLHRAFKIGAAQDPNWASHFCASLEPGWVFKSSGSEAWPRLLGLLAREGDPYAVALLQTSAAGMWECNRRQFDEVLLHYSLLETDPNALVSLLQGAAQSLAMVENPESMSMLALILLEPRAWPAGDSRAALSTIFAWLGDDRTASPVALQVLSSDLGVPIPGIDSGLWSEIVDRSTAIAHAQGWVIGGRQY